MVTNDDGRVHHFLDEVGDTTFYGKGKQDIIGQQGVSLCFGIGIAKIDRPLEQVRTEIRELQAKVENHPFLRHIPSVKKRVDRGGFFFHACKDSDDVKLLFMEYLSTLPCEAEVCMARKNPSRFTNKHNGNKDEFYADILSHLITSRLKKDQELVLNVADRGSSTRTNILDSALAKATKMASSKWGKEELKTKIVFNVQNPSQDPLLCVADYLCWAVQRVFERGETRHYDYLKDKIGLVVDIYDTSKFEGSRNCYDSRENPLTADNKIARWLPKRDTPQRHGDDFQQQQA